MELVSRNIVTTSAGLDAQRVALHHADAVFQAQRFDALGGDAAEVRPDFDADGFGAEFLGGRNHDTAIAAAQIVYDLARLDAARLQHALHNGLRGRNIRSEVLGGPELLAERRKHGENRRGRNE